MMRCRTCPTELTASEEMNGLRRCRPCRKTTPGRLLTPSAARKKRYPRNHPYLNYPTGFTKASRGDGPSTGRLPAVIDGRSWWETAPAGGITDLAYQRFPEASRPARMPIAMSPNGRCE